MSIQQAPQARTLGELLNHEVLERAAIHLVFRLLTSLPPRICWRGVAALRHEDARSLGLPKSHFAYGSRSADDEFDDDLDDLESASKSKAKSKSTTFKLVAKDHRLHDCMRDSRADFEFATMALRERMEDVQRDLCIPELELQFLLLALGYSAHPLLAAVCDAIPMRDWQTAPTILSRFLGGTQREWHPVLAGRSNLHKNGLLTSDGLRSHTDLNNLLNVKEGFSYRLLSQEPLRDLLVSDALVPPKPGTCTSEDFAHLSSQLKLITSLMAGGCGPAHVLIAGSPGTGKSELAQCVAKLLGRKLLAVRADDDDGEPASRSERLAHYRLGSKLLGAQSDTLIVFDEVEDVFQGEHLFASLGRSSDEVRGKGWITQLFESVSTPTFWITNDLESVDPAYRRRCDYILQLEAPPRSMRMRLLLAAVGNAPVSKELLQKASDSDLLTPADTARLARLLPRAIESGMAADEAFIHLIAMRHEGISRQHLQAVGRRGPKLPFQLSWVNVDVDLASVIEGLRRQGSGSLLLSGPPGTGKTEFVKHLAVALDRPLHLKKASDLIDKHVGETEKRIAQAFEQAQQDHAILFLDEADSFLQSRERATHSWQVTEVNELLAQLDGYGGLCVLATNHIDSLDRAVLRRMDVKLRFRPLRADATEAAYRQALLALGCKTEPTEGNLRRVRDLNELCFGDFAAALRGLTLVCVATEDSASRLEVRLVEALADELHCKKVGTGRGIGFL